jgi:phosphoribosylglycinamide formyltransferase-1
MLKIVICVSGGGTNLQAVMDAMENGSIQNVEIVGVISNNANAYALERAKKNGMKAICISPKEYTSREEFNVGLFEGIKKLQPDLIVLAGFLVTIPEQMSQYYKKRMINIHPSLIPSFCGKGYYGLKVHEAALKRGVKITGATVHFVDAGMDTGPIILQKAVSVMSDDTPESLQKRVLEEAEWEILPLAIHKIAIGEISIG